MLLTTVIAYTSDLFGFLLHAFGYHQVAKTV